MTELHDLFPGVDTIENRARQALQREIEQSPEDATASVQLWDDEWEQWHVHHDRPGTVDLPLRAARAYEFARLVWDEAQAVLDKAVGELEDQYPEEAKDRGWHHELFRGEITASELAARLEPCPHPEDQLDVFESKPDHDGTFYRSVKCERCAQYIDRGYQEG